MSENEGGMSENEGGMSENKRGMSENESKWAFFLFGNFYSF